MLDALSPESSRLRTPNTAPRGKSAVVFRCCSATLSGLDGGVQINRSRRRTHPRNKSGDWETDVNHSLPLCSLSASCVLFLFFCHGCWYLFLRDPKRRRQKERVQETAAQRLEYELLRVLLFSLPPLWGSAYTNNAWTPLVIRSAPELYTSNQSWVIFTRFLGVARSCCKRLRRMSIFRRHREML